MRTKLGVLGGLMVGLLLLVACDSASPTPVVPTPIRATPTRIPPTVTPVLIVPTFVVASPSPAATATPVFVATATAIPATPIPVTTATSGGSVSPVTPTVLRQATVPYILGTEEIEVDSALLVEIAKQMAGVSTSVIHFYVSDQDVPTLKALASTAFTNQGYLAVSPFTLEEPVIAFFAKPNAPDLVFSTATIPANPADLLKTMFNISNPSSELAQKFTAQLNGKKSLMVIISTSGLSAATPDIPPHKP